MVSVSPDPLALDGLVADRFRVVSELGRGGMAVVYLAEDLSRQDHLVALKLVPPSQQEDDLSLRRFRREAAMLARLRHPNILEILDSGSTDQGGLWLSMPRLEGEDLDRRLRRGRLGTKESLRIARRVAEGLAHAHGEGIVHRDLKPSNIYLDAAFSPPMPRILDFGISRVFNDPSLTRLTSSGRTLGSPGYMSPEQILGLELDGKSDVYALGVLLFQMLTGRPPFPLGGDMFKILRAHLEQPAPSLSELAPGEDFAPELERLVAAMLEKAPPNRPRDMSSVATLLARLEAEATETADAPGRPAPRDSRAPAARRRASLPARGPSLAALSLAAILGGGSVVALVLMRTEPKPSRVLLAEEPVPVRAEPSAPSVIEPSAEPRAQAQLQAEAEVEALVETVEAPKAAAPEARPARALPARARTPSLDSVSGALRSEARKTSPASDLSEHLQLLDEAPSPEARVAARSAIVGRLRRAIEALPAEARPLYSSELAGLAVAGSAEGFRRLHRRIIEAARPKEQP